MVAAAFDQAHAIVGAIVLAGCVAAVVFGTFILIVTVGVARSVPGPTDESDKRP